MRGGRWESASVCGLSKAGESTQYKIFCDGKGCAFVDLRAATMPPVGGSNIPPVPPVGGPGVPPVPPAGGPGVPPVPPVPPAGGPRRTASASGASSGRARRTASAACTSGRRTRCTDCAACTSSGRAWCIDCAACTSSGRARCTTCAACSSRLPWRGAAKLGQPTLLGVRRRLYPGMEWKRMGNARIILKEIFCRKQRGKDSFLSGS